MTPEAVISRSAIESLRSGVPSRHAVAQLGTTQNEIKLQFQESLDMLIEGQPVKPILIAANFGGGKSHLLEYLQTLAEHQHFVTSYVVVSSEMPLGNPHVVLKTLAESSRAPERMGKALRALMADFSASSAEYAQLRQWAKDANIDDSLRALLHVYEEFRADETLRSQVLDDFEGKPLLKSVIKGRLREIGQAAAYDLSGPKATLLAHERIRLLAQFYKAAGCHGLVVLVDEVERVAKFSLNQRSAAYQELAWWKEIAAKAGSAILPVFAMTQSLLDDCIRGGKRDTLKFISTPGFAQDVRDARASDGIDLLTSYSLLDAPDSSQTEEVKYRVKNIYEQAYGITVPPVDTNDPRAPIRSKIRRWITLWDLYRYDPTYTAAIQEEAIHFDTADISDAELSTGEEEDGG